MKNITIHFCQMYDNYPLNDRRTLNEDCVYKVRDACFEEEPYLCSDKNILFFFADNGLSIIDPDLLGFFIPKRSLNYVHFRVEWIFRSNRPPIPVQNGHLSERSDAG
jgi:hypothetical protein